MQLKLRRKSRQNYTSCPQALYEFVYRAISDYVELYSSRDEEYEYSVPVGAMVNNGTANSAKSVHSAKSNGSGPYCVPVGSWICPRICLFQRICTGGLGDRPELCLGLQLTLLGLPRGHRRRPHLRQRRTGDHGANRLQNTAKYNQRQRITSKDYNKLQTKQKRHQ